MNKPPTKQSNFKKKNEVVRPTQVWGDMFRKSNELSESLDGKVYKVEPVDILTFVTHPDYIGIDLYGLSEPQREFLDGMTDFENGKTLGVLWVGKGGGKNFTSTVMFSYLAYKLMCMYDPHKYFNRSSIKAITLINVAINSAQAKANFFDPLCEMIRGAGPKAFRDFGFDPDRDILAREITFPKNIVVVSGHSQAGGMEGYDILAALLDECDDSEYHGVEKMLTTLRSSSKSRFFGREKIITISYSRYEGSNGKIKQLYEDFRDVENALVMRVPSWEFNPNPNYTRESLNDEFRENEAKAKCIYGCDPGDGYLDSWIKDAKRIENTMPRSTKWILGMPVPHDNWRKEPWAEFTWTDDVGYEHRLDPYNIPIAERGIPDMKYVFIGDPGLGSDKTGGDAYGVCLAHREMIINEYGHKHPRTVIDFAFRFTGAMFKEGQVQMAAIEDLVYKLKDKYGFDIRIFSFDGWNSVSTTQAIARKYKGVHIHPRNIVTLEHYSALRDNIFGEQPPSNGEGRTENNGGISIPWHPILFWELKELREDRGESGKQTKTVKITHESSSHNDMSDCVAMANFICIKQWPYTEARIAGINQEQMTKYGINQPKMSLEDRFKLTLKQKEEEARILAEKKAKAIEEANKNVFGLGKFQKGRY